jgi:hypothetical protein
MSFTPALFSGSRRRVSGVKEVSTVTFDYTFCAGVLGEYITLSDAAGPLYIWFDRDGGYSDPAPSGFTRGIASVMGDIPPNAPAFVAVLVATMNADPSFTATGAANVVTITDRLTGARTHIGQGSVIPLVATVATLVNGS